MSCSKHLLAFFLYLQYCTAMFGQQHIEVDGITFSYQIEGDALRCELQALTNGWVGVGFNSKNAIVGSDLLLFNLVDGNPSCADLYVKSFGNPIKDEDLGGNNSIELLSAHEDEMSTVVRFTIPVDSGHPTDYVHSINQDFWLILAYSAEDDFEHHSRVRRHLPFRLNQGK
ncbi:MAG: DOMON domain-containing protein [Bacteroidota bacterium]